LIKRLFIISHVWTYDDLLVAVRKPPFGIEVNPAMIDESNFVIALNFLTLSHITLVDTALDDEIRNNTLSAERLIISTLFDQSERYIYKNYNKHKISHMGNYYILFPVVTINSVDKVIRDIESYNRPVSVSRGIKINLTKWIQETKEDYNYDIKIKQFLEKYEDYPLINIFNEYGPEFYERLTMDVVVGGVDGGEPFALDIIGLLDKFKAVIYIKDVLVYLDVAKKFTGENVIKWRKSAKTAKPYSDFADSTPIGFISYDSIKLYDSPNWISINKVAMNVRTQFTENNTIVAYFDTGADQITRFKIRRPVQSIRIDAMKRTTEKGTDTRLIERGIVCATKNKNELVEIAKNIGININKIGGGSHLKVNKQKQLKIRSICDAIRFKMLEMEIKERQKESKHKYVYMPWESQPPMM
jgi:hypothetical protein